MFPKIYPTRQASIHSDVIDEVVHAECLGIKCQFIEAEWRIYAPVNFAIIGPDNDLLSVWNQDIIWTSTGVLLIEPLGINFSEILSKLNYFHSYIYQ